MALTRPNGQWPDLTTLLSGEVVWTYQTGTVVVCESAETGVTRWSRDARRLFLYQRCAADGQGRVCSVGVGHDDHAAAVFEGMSIALLSIPLGPAAGPFAVEIEGLKPSGWRIYVMRTTGDDARGIRATYSVLRLTEFGDVVGPDVDSEMPATSQGFLDIRDGQIVTSDGGRNAHGLVLPNRAGDVWAGQLPDPNGVALFDESTQKRSTLFIGDSQPPHIAIGRDGRAYVTAWRERGIGAWLESYARPFTSDPEGPIEDTSGQPIDLWPYFVQFKPEAFPRTSSIPTHGHDMHCVFNGRDFWTLPFGEPDHWVRMVVEGDTLTFREDRSRDGQNTGDYSFTHGRWANRHMKVGQRILNPDNCLVRYQPDGCRIVDVHRFPFTTGLWQHWFSFDCGGDLGWQDVIAYLYDPGGNADTYELSYFAKGYGFFRWEEYDQRTNVLRHWTTFNEFGGRAPQPTPGCWKREHLALTPHNWQPTPKPPIPNPKPPVETRKMVSFKTVSGHYLCAESGGGREVNATRTAPGPWETFEVIPHEGGIALKANNGQFVCAENGGGGALNANRDVAGAWERFTAVKVDGGIALQSIDGQFVCAELGGGGEVNVTRTAAGAWETFDAPALSGTHGGGGHVGGDAIGYLPPAGMVRMEGWCLADDHGPRPMLSATLMDAETQFVNDRGRLQRNVEYCRTHGVDFVRILSEVDWPGGEANPRHVEQTVETIRFIWSLGMRTELTIFGSHSHLSEDEKMRWTGEVSRAIRDAGLEVALALVEIINEPGGARVGPGECQRLAWKVREYLPHVPLAFGAPYQDWAGTTTGWEENEEGARAYKRFCESPATIATPHLDRGINGTEGEYRICRQGWIAMLMGFPWGNNEPSGPGASAQHGHVMRDPTMQRVHANGAWLQRAAFHCWHANAGVGLNTDSLLESEPGLPGLSAVRAILPGDIANFSAKNWHWGDNPVETIGGVRDGNPHGPVRTHGLVNGGRVVIHALGVDHGAEYRARNAMHLTRYSWDGTQYAPAEELHVSRDQRFHVPPAPDQIYVGRFV